MTASRIFEGLGLACLLAVGGNQPVLAGSPVSAHIAQRREAMLQEYIELLRIPNVASNEAEIRRNAQRLFAMLDERGLKPRLLDLGPGVPPAVYGEWLVPGATRTLVFYAHYDGQPAVPTGWKATTPWEPKIYSAAVEDGGIPVDSDRQREIGPEWRIYGRSAADDKLGVYAILEGLDALRTTGAAPKVNIKIFLEGEEEAGSPNLERILRQHTSLLQSDGWIIFDGPVHQNGSNLIYLGARGVSILDMEVFGPTRPLHSGHYGNWAPNPAMRLAHLLASMQAPDGTVLIDSFYDDVIPLQATERQAVENAPRVEDGLRLELGIAMPLGNGRPMAALINEPSFNIDGLSSAVAGPGSRNVVPVSATATIDMRLVVGNDHARQAEKVERHIRSQGYHVVRREPTAEERLQHPRIARVKRRAGYNAARTPLNSEFAWSVISAVSRTGPPPIVLPTTGGSLPLYIIQDVLGAPSIMVGLANHDNNQHGEDENVAVEKIWDAIALVAAIAAAE